jgi:hypothetical protein
MQTVGLLLVGLTIGEKIPAHDQCSVEMFERSLKTLLNPDDGMLNEWTDSDAVLERYRTGPARWINCKNPPSEAWPMSTGRTTPLIINVGEGSTATRFLNCVMRRVGLSGAHTKGAGADKPEENTAFMGCDAYSSCTAGWDKFNYISDSPVVYQVGELLATHPDALVLHSFRDAAGWKRSRINKHADQGAANWYQGGVCGGADHPMNHSLTELDFVVFNTWAHCVSPKDRYLAINLFTQRSSSMTILDILLFLRKHGIDLLVTIFTQTKRNLDTNPSHFELARALDDSCVHEGTLAPGVDIPAASYYLVKDWEVSKSQPHAVVSW